jgi:hypothetical protein
MNSLVWKAWYESYVSQCAVYGVKPPSVYSAEQLFLDDMTPREAAYYTAVTRDTRRDALAGAVAVGIGCAFGAASVSFAVIYFGGL